MKAISAPINIKTALIVQTLDFEIFKIKTGPLGTEFQFDSDMKIGNVTLYFIHTVKINLTFYNIGTGITHVNEANGFNSNELHVQMQFVKLA